MTAKIELEHVAKIFGKHPRGRALEMLKSGASNEEIRRETRHIVGVADISAEIQEGEVFVVMGLSGSGKSTLIRCINRIHDPTAGSVLIDGEDVTQLSAEQMRQLRRKKTTMVFQHFALFPHKTVLENTAYGLKVQGVDAAARNERAQEMLEVVGLGAWGKRYPDSLSGGMQQRVGLARALAPDPDILLMDEAFSALDPLIRRQMQNELLALQDRVQKTIVFITHDLNEALRVGTRVMVMKEGRAVQVGTPTEIVTEPEDEYVADFMADVDHAKVLTAEFAMKEVAAFAADVPAAEAVAQIGPGSVGFVVDDAGRPQAIVHGRDLDGSPGSVAEAATNDFSTAPHHTSLAALFHVSSDGRPVAIVDGDGKLLGSVSPLDLLSSLGRVEVVDDPHKAAERAAAGFAVEETPGPEELEQQEVGG